MSYIGHLLGLLPSHDEAWLNVRHAITVLATKAAASKPDEEIAEASDALARALEAAVTRDGLELSDWKGGSIPWGIPVEDE